ncbi:3,4-dihydroxy-2-butanone-4-phosphate synthase, partial [Vibrio parahaemolyticus]|nr:3,4-dihydroxy-2-butanone-4-phosphate synthase [Vibrio parahaemolyticus]
MTIRTKKEIIDDIRARKMLILIEDEDRENEGELIMAAGHNKTEEINYMATYGLGFRLRKITNEN